MISYDVDAVCAAVRAPVFRGHMSASQEAGTKAIITAWQVAQPSGDIRFIAYMLATAAWETAHTMQPVKEFGSDAYFTRMYDIRGARPAVARELGNTKPGDGARFCGRGLPQTTGRAHYAWASTIVGKDCVANPDLLLVPAWATAVMFAGMLTGHYTGRKLADYFNGLHTDWINARRIINGTDHAEEVAAIAEHFYAALKAAAHYSGAAPKPVPVAAPAVAIASKPVAAAAPAPGLFSQIAAFFRS